MKFSKKVFFVSVLLLSFTMKVYGDSLKEVFRDKTIQRLNDCFERIDTSKFSCLDDPDLVFSLFLSHNECDFYDCCDIFKRCYIAVGSGALSKQTEKRCLKCTERIFLCLHYEKDTALSICRQNGLSQVDLNFLDALKPLEFARRIKAVINKKGDADTVSVHTKTSSK